MSRDSNNLIHLNGDVQLNRAGQTIRADELIIDTQSEQLEANGGVIFEDINYRLKTETLRLNQKDGTAWFGPTEFKLRLSHASGTADEIEKIDEYRSRYHRILYTTCDPEDKDWHLKASELTIDDESGRGTARHTTIYFQNVPFLYLPYFMFPIDDRRLSGVLTPLLSYSQSSGTSFALPVYWNVAPNLDATITPVWYSKRGLQMILEGRYLYENHAGQVDLAYLDDDLVNSSRWFRKWQHSATPGLDINADLLLQEVSDDEYFRDFDFLTTENDNIKHLERHLTFSHN
ncbi:MAG: putative LPS assembly protein LptD, partial [Gammaproteobacteria bacterium]|nr:putative LPS assembly protein LptD [Gammaproteobacteria bacterium]